MKQIFSPSHTWRSPLAMGLITPLPRLGPPRYTRNSKSESFFDNFGHTRTTVLPTKKAVNESKRRTYTVDSTFTITTVDEACSPEACHFAKHSSHLVTVDNECVNFMLHGAMSSKQLPVFHCVKRVHAVYDFRLFLYQSQVLSAFS